MISSDARQANNSGPLAGIRVLELSNVIAGPTACQHLADFGAEVIKIEHPKGGDGSRSQGRSKEGISLWWKMLGRNKRSIGMYLGDPEVAEIFCKLVSTADVVVEGFRAGTLEKWNLGYEKLASVNPRIILARLSGFGQTGPYAHRPAFGTNIEAMAGLPQLTGEPDGPPTMSVFALGDYLAGTALLGAITMALYHRDAKGGTGQEIDASIYAPLLTMMSKSLIHFDQLGILEKRTGNRSATAAPRAAFKTRDNKWINVAAATEQTAARIMTLVGCPEMAQEPWFKTSAGRVQHGDEIDRAIAKWMAERDRDEALAQADKVGATMAPMYEVDEIFSDPHVQATEALKEVADKDLGSMRMPNVLFKMSATPGSIRWTGEDLGASTDAVLTGEMGVAPEVLTRLRERGVLA